MKKVRTRFAPSPTGMMHVGNLRSAIFEYLIAKSNNGDFIIRIEDTDQERKVDNAVELIYKTCEMCGLIPDESPKVGGDYGPYTQSERLDLYKEYAHKLVDLDKAYYCFCGDERLDFLRKEAELNKVAFMYDGLCKSLSKEEALLKINNGDKYVIRQKMPKEGISVYNDLVYGKISIENKFLEDQVLLKSDGFPTYNFANVIDDHLMDITHVVRGNEYLSSTPKYNLLYDAYGWEKPIYIHLPMVVDEDLKKLSKRHGASSFDDLLNKGYLPEAVVNYLSLLGWSPETNDEIFTLDELKLIFNPKRISKAPAVYDIKKLNWINAHYIKKMALEDLYKITYPHLSKAYDLSNLSDEWVLELIKIYQDHISHGEEIVPVTDLFFKTDINIGSEEKDILNNDEANIVLNCFEDEIKTINEWSVSNISLAISNVKEKTNIKGKMLFMPIRIKVSGQMHGPELPNTVFLLGKELVLSRLKA